MTQRDVQIATEDGISAASLHLPDGSGSWPGAIMYPDVAGYGTRCGGWANIWQVWVT